MKTTSYMLSMQRGGSENRSGLKESTVKEERNEKESTVTEERNEKHIEEKEEWMISSFNQTDDDMDIL